MERMATSQWLHLQTNAAGKCRAQLSPCCFTGHSLQDGLDIKHMTVTCKPIYSHDAYNALGPSPNTQDFHGLWIWWTKVPNKVKVFAWLYFNFKDHLSTKENMLHKRVHDDTICYCCSHTVEDRLHIFFGCHLSRELWSCVGLSFLASADDIDILSPPSALGNDPATWPSILLNYTMAIVGCQKWHHFRKGATLGVPNRFSYLWWLNHLGGEVCFCLHDLGFAPIVSFSLIMYEHATLGCYLSIDL